MFDRQQFFNNSNEINHTELGISAETATLLARRGCGVNLADHNTELREFTDINYDHAQAANEIAHTRTLRRGNNMLGAYGRCDIATAILFANLSTPTVIALRRTYEID